MSNTLQSLLNGRNMNKSTILSYFSMHTIINSGLALRGLFGHLILQYTQTDKHAHRITFINCHQMTIKPVNNFMHCLP